MKSYLMQICYFILMDLYKISPNFWYMCFFRYIFSTFSLPFSPIYCLAVGCCSKNSMFWARAGAPRRPRGWSRPVTLCSTISFVPPESVPRTYNHQKSYCSMCNYVRIKKPHHLSWHVERSVIGHVCVVIDQ